MNRLTLTAVAMMLIISTASAEKVTDRCERLEIVSRVSLNARHLGIPRRDLVNNDSLDDPSLSDDFIRIINDAYRMRRFTDDARQQQAIDRFSAQVYQDCLRERGE